MNLPAWMSGDSDVLDVIASRRRARSTPLSRDDEHRVALVIEGGGMRGAYLGGMVRGLGLLGLKDSFDDVFAVSAGAFSAVGLLLGNVSNSVRVYPEVLAPGGFVSWKRFLSGSGPLISLDYLIDDVMTHQMPVRFGDLGSVAPVLRPVATDLDAMTPVAFTDLTGDEEWKLALRASGNVPLYAGPPVVLRGRRYVDGFVADALPIARAISAGATHVLALTARAPGERLRAGSGRRSAAINRRRYDGVAPGLGALMAERAASYADSLALITDRSHRLRGSARVLALRPTHAVGVAALTTDPTRLWRAGGAGEDALRSAMAWIAGSSRPSLG